MPDLSFLDNPFLFRAIRTKRWLAQVSAAFRLRPNELGLSVILNANCTKEICDAEQNTCFGEFVLETKSVIEGGRPVEHDATNHAEILGLPLYDADELLKEEAASELADSVIDVRKRPS